MNKPNADPLLEDIRRSVKAGYFDDWQPSELLATPVEELLGRVAMMSDAGRRKYLKSIGHQGGAAASPGVSSLPADDPIRYAGSRDDGYRPGELLAKEDLSKLLDGIIESWPVWRAMPAIERVGGWLSRGGGKEPAEKGRGNWLSRGV
tara:strand:- start:672 stop:1115 length:444 start_codon:yes stop_codon:yes gene_type:complete